MSNNLNQVGTCEDGENCNKISSSRCEKQKPVVMLLHGSLCTGAMWNRITAEIGEDFEYLTPDLIGYGKSHQWTRNRSLVIEDEVEALLPLIETRDTEFHLVGHSYGGVAALELAHTKPQQIHSLTLIEPVSVDILRAAGDTEAYDKISDVWDSVIMALGKDGAIPALQDFLSYWTGSAPYKELSGELASAPDHMALKILSDWRAAFGKTWPIQKLGDLKVPTFLLSGENSQLATQRICFHLAKQLPFADQKMIRGAGHMFPLTHGSLTARTLKYHFQRNMPAA